MKVIKLGLMVLGISVFITGAYAHTGVNNNAWFCSVSANSNVDWNADGTQLAVAYAWWIHRYDTQLQPIGRFGDDLLADFSVDPNDNADHDDEIAISNHVNFEFAYTNWASEGELVFGGTSATVVSWDVLTGNYERLFDVNWVGIYNFDVSQGDWLAMGAQVFPYQFAVEIVDTVDDIRYEIWIDSIVLSVAWHPVDSLLAVAQGSGLIQIFNPETDKPIMSIRLESGNGDVLSWQPLGDLIAIGSQSGSLAIWDTRNDAVYELERQSSWIQSLTWSPDSQRLATINEDHEIHVWEPLSQELLHDFELQAQDEVSLAWHPQENLLAAFDCSGTLQLIDMDTLTVIASTNVGVNN